MTTTLAPPRAETAFVNCARCGTRFVMSCDEIRRLVDADEQPACGGTRCGRRAAANARLARQRPRAPVAPPPPRATKADVVLLAVAAWVAAAGRDAPQAECAVAAWRADAAAFGLPGYERLYPNSNRVILCLVKLVELGHLERPAPLHYRLTDAGRARVRRLTTP